MFCTKRFLAGWVMKRGQGETCHILIGWLGGRGRVSTPHKLRKFKSCGGRRSEPFGFELSSAVPPPEIECRGGNRQKRFSPHRCYLQNDFLVSVGCRAPRCGETVITPFKSHQLHSRGQRKRPLPSRQSGCLLVRIPVKILNAHSRNRSLLPTA